MKLFFCVSLSMVLSACGTGSPLEAALLVSPEGQVLSIQNGKDGKKVAFGETCVSDDQAKICLGMKFVSYENPQGNPVVNPDQAVLITQKLNMLWGVCNIAFQIDQYQAVDPAKYGLSFGGESQDEVDDIRRIFSFPADHLLAVTTGPWDTAVNAWTAMPGEGPYGAVMEAGAASYGDGIIYAHEFGHYLGLDHVSDESDLMNPVIYTSSLKVDQDQCQVARATVSSYWSAMVRHSR